MPATDSYWRSLKKMHLVFVASAVAMLAATVWMMQDDHDREYFKYQRTFDKIKAEKARQQIRAIRTASFQKDMQALEDRVVLERNKLDEKSETIADLKSKIAAKDVELTLAEAKLKLLKSEQSKAAADRDLAIRDELPAATIAARQREFDAKKRQVDQQTSIVEALRADRGGRQQELAAITRDYDLAKQQRDDKLKEIALIQKAMDKIEPETGWKRFKRRTMEWPIIQGFNSHLRIYQDWLPKLEIKLGMTSTARFDRCRTCHLGIDQVEAGNVPAFPHGKPDSDDYKTWVRDKKFPHPYSTHPNPDLYLTATSPHPVSRFGCTICHDGNGSGTSFQNAEHGPNSPFQAGRWKAKHHYHANHFWEYPMHPKRLTESGCIKCHHNVEELGVNPKFGASAPQVYKGYRLIQNYGCFGCHEVNGFERGKSIGPDLRLEPNYTEAALQFRYLTQPWEKKKSASGFSLAAARELVARIIDAPEESNAAREQLTELIQKERQAKQDALKKLATQRLSAAERKARKQAILASHVSDEALALADQFKTVEHPGKYRKVGPSLRSIRQKTSRDFIRYWTEEPKRFRPTTRMPQFFKLTNQQDPHAQKLTPVEIAGIAQYLHDKSQDIALLSPAKDYKPDAKAGKDFFARKGCVACHSHKDVKGTTATFGPDLSRIAAKVKRDADDPKFSKWLYTWIRDPQRYHKRSKMPYLFLSTAEPVPTGQTAKDGKKLTRNADVAADITAYLLQGDADTLALQTKQFRNHADDRLPGVNSEALNELVEMSLKGKALTTEQVETFFKTKQYPITDLSLIKGDEIELARGTLAGPPDKDNWTQVRLNYVGRKTISRYGCYACHDIPGFERSRPIGTTLQDWGRKETSKLAFEHIREYLQHHGEPNGGSTLKRAESAISHARGGEFTNDAVRKAELSAAFFFNSIMHHDRAGFIWQKLRQPRSYDFKKIETKGYDERLRMPKFPVDEQEIEAIATFVLGLVAEPPPPEYQYAPTGPARDRIEGERLLKKYNCVGCHMTELPKVTLWTDVGKPPFGPRPKKEGEPDPLGLDLLNTLMPPRVVDLSTKREKTGQTQISFHGLRVFDPAEDPEEEDKVYYENWEHLKIGANLLQPSQDKISILKQDLVSVTPGRGGDFAEWLFRYLKGQQRRLDADFADRARHQLPPVLYREGYKVQTAWLYRFLKDPHPLRHMAVLRMPRFTLSRQDAQTLANYFAAVDGVPYPYQQVPQRNPGYIAAQSAKFAELMSGAKQPGYLTQGYKLLVNPKLCRTCHSVGGYPAQQGTDPKAVQGPNLEYATDRLRPDWLKLWLANPVWTTPYTKMPVNFKPTDDPTKRAYVESFQGDAAAQWNAVRDALMNYHNLMEQHRETKFQYPIEKKKDDKQPPANGTARKAVPPRKADD